jgi:hydroxyethylthiazole kinase-like uncharacterized protein yjeF
MKHVTPALLRRMPLPMLGPDSDKDARGCVLVIAGSTSVPGAVLLAGVATLRAGAGKLQLATDRELAIQLGLAVPEALVIPLSTRGAQKALAPHIDKADAILIGPGMEEGAAVKQLVRGVAARMCPTTPLVLDAAALGATEFIQRGVITPHAGEMATLLGIEKEEVEANAPDVARAAADRYGCVVALKGSTSYIAAAGELYRFDGGAVGLATSGSGDTLAGIVAGLAARGADPLTAALWGVWAHGTAGLRLEKEIGRVGFLARELLDEIPRLVGGKL